VRSLFREYAASLSIDLCFQNFEAEHAGLPGKYKPPKGRILLAWADTDATCTEAIGCVALRPLEGPACEMKPLCTASGTRPATWAPACRTHLQGSTRHRLLMDLPRHAPNHGSGTEAIHGTGLQPIGPYVFNPVPGAIFLALEL
jgi:hypothetical protein